MKTQLLALFLTILSQNVYAQENDLDKGIKNVCEHEINHVKQDLTRTDFYFLGRAMGVIDMAATNHVIHKEEIPANKSTNDFMILACQRTLNDKRLKNSSFYTIFKYNAYEVMK